MSGRLSAPPLRLGRIEYINSLPVDAALIRGVVGSELVLVPGKPAECNARLASGALDLSPISAVAYAERQPELLLMPELSISSESGVRSVLLFSRVPAARLAGVPILVKPHGRTTPILLEVLCREFYGFLPRIEMLPESSSEVPGHAEAFLSIGDEALLSKDRLAAAGWHVTDLAEEWRAWTGLPIVFAVWAVRREVFKRSPEAVFRAHEALIASKEWGLSHPEEVLRMARERIALPESALKDYFAALSYDFDARFRAGMSLFFKLARQLGLLSNIEPFETIGENPHIHSHV